MKEKKVVYPGSFDPPTKGHLDIIDRGLTIFDKVIAAVIVNPSKKSLFSVKERCRMLDEIYRDNPKVEVDKFDGLLVKYVQKKGANIILRGLRAVSDFEYEFQMALMNRKLNPEVKSVYLMPSPEFTFLSSSIVKEVCSLGGDVSGLVPAVVEKDLKSKLL